MADVSSAPPRPMPAMHIAQSARFIFLSRLLAGLMVLLLVAAIVVGALYWKVQNRLAATEREQASNAAVASTAVSDIAATEKEVMNITAGNCASVKALVGWINGQTSQTRSSIPNIAGLLTALQGLCSFDRSQYGAVDSFLSAYAPAVVARQQADYPTAAADYGKALAVPGAQPELRARAYEGLAYSDLKLGRNDEAQTAARAGAALGVDYVFTQITALKIACQVKTPAPDVRAQFAAAMADRNAKITLSAQDPFRSKIAASDRDLLTKNAELKAMCGYAGV